MTWILIAGLLLAGPQPMEVKSAEQQVHESLRALPEAFRAGATVVGYDASGERVTLKKGTNDMTCWADDPRPDVDWGNPYYVVCFPELESEKVNPRGEVGTGRRHQAATTFA